MDLTQDLRKFLLESKVNEEEVGGGDVDLNNIPDANAEAPIEENPAQEEQVLVLGDKFEVVQDEKGELVLKKIEAPVEEEVPAEAPAADEVPAAPAAPVAESKKK